MAEAEQQFVLSESHDLNAIIVEILSRVPAKSLIRFRCVSKGWRALISESYFIKMHLSHIDTESISNWKLLLSTRPPQAIDYQALSNIASNEHDDDGPVASREVDYPVMGNFILDPFDLRDLIGSCNGLVCLSLLNSNMIMLGNPCTKVIQSLPYPTCFSSSRDSLFYGFGYDSVTDDCKIVVGSNGPVSGSGSHEGIGFEETMIQVFALKTGSWRTIESLDFVVLEGMGCVVNGGLHWLEQQPWEQWEDGLFASKILCFGLAEEKFWEIAFPCPLDYEERDYFSVGIGALNDCLTVYFIPDGFDYSVWVMKEYGVKESWSEILRIPDEVLPPDYAFCYQPLLFFENDEVLMSLNGEFLALYNQKEKKFRNVFKADDMNGWCRTTAYVETLVSPLISDELNVYSFSSDP